MLENSLNLTSRPASREPQVASTAAVSEHATIGPSIVIKGEISGTETLFIEGAVEGAINFPGHRVTVGRGSKVAADIDARDVVVMGSVKGNVHCGDLLDVRSESSITGGIVTQRIRIDDGAVLKGSVEVHVAGRSNGKAKDQVQSKAAVAEAAKPAVPEPAAPAGAATVAKRVPATSSLLEPVR